MDKMNIYLNVVFFKWIKNKQDKTTQTKLMWSRDSINQYNVEQVSYTSHVLVNGDHVQKKPPIRKNQERHLSAYHKYKDRKVIYSIIYTAQNTTGDFLSVFIRSVIFYKILWVEFTFLNQFHITVYCMTSIRLFLPHYEK